MIEQPNLKMNQLLSDYASKKITMEELDRECAYWYLDCFEEIYPKPLPTPPNRYREYQEMDIMEKREIPNSFWLIPEIKNYIDQKTFIKEENKANLLNLKKFLAHIPQQDFTARNSFEQKIREFEHSELA